MKRDAAPTEYTEGIRCFQMGCRPNGTQSDELMRGWLHAQEIDRNARENAQVRRNERRLGIEEDNE